jgi:hypothetical protein
MKENEDYELITHDGLAEAWAIRILSGPFVETVFAFGAVSFNEVKDHISFNFEVIESPDPMATSRNTELQEYVADILQDVILTGVEKGTVELQERDQIELKD